MTFLPWHGRIGQEDPLALQTMVGYLDFVTTSSTREKRAGDPGLSRPIVAAPTSNEANCSLNTS